MLAIHEKLGDGWISQNNVADMWYAQHKAILDYQDGSPRSPFATEVEGISQLRWVKPWRLPRLSALSGSVSTHLPTVSGGLVSGGDSILSQ